MSRRLFWRIMVLIALNIFIISLVTYTNSLDSSPVLSQLGSRSEEVRRIQTRLKDWGYYTGSIDGIYGTKTEMAVRYFQQRNGLVVDGIAGPATLAAMGLSSDTAATAASSSTTLKRGSQGSTVRTLQTRLKEWGYYTGAVDGVYGAATEAAVKKFQKKNGLTVDGIAGPATLRAIGISGGSSTTSSNNASSVSNSDYQLLARIISAEARGEPYSGQVAVGAVILNRVKHPSFPDSIAGVIYQPGAFTAITDGQIHEAIIDSAYKAAKEALNGADPSGGCIYYYNPDKTSNKWIRSRPVVVRIGSHLFCK